MIIVSAAIVGVAASLLMRPAPTPSRRLLPPIALEFTPAIAPEIANGPVPRLHDGLPDLTGPWVGGGSTTDIEAQGGLKPGEFPLLPWARALRDSRREQDDPYLYCVPSGIPRSNSFPWRVLQAYTAKGPTHIFVIHEHGDAGGRRQIFMDGRRHPVDPIPTWWGHSIGRWEGDTLLIDTVGINDKYWFDRRGTPHTEQLHIIERWTRINYGKMTKEMTLDDPGAFSRPVNLKFEAAALPPGEELMEFICIENNQYRRGGGHSEHLFREGLRSRDGTEVACPSARWVDAAVFAGAPRSKRATELVMLRRTLIWMALLVVLFSSGAAGLINQVVWQRALKVFLGGSESISSMIVVVVFLGGLGAGSWLAGRSALWLKNPLLALAVLELTLGAVNFGVRALLTTDISDSVFAAQRVGTTFGVPLWMIYGAGASIVLLLPSALMGATMPFAAEACQRRLGETDSRRLGWLLFANTFGAVAGTMVGSGYLMPEVRAVCGVVAGGCPEHRRRSARTVPEPTRSGSSGGYRTRRRSEPTSAIGCTLPHRMALAGARLLCPRVPDALVPFGGVASRTAAVYVRRRSRWLSSVPGASVPR